MCVTPQTFMSGATKSSLLHVIAIEEAEKTALPRIQKRIQFC